MHIRGLVEDGLPVPEPQAAAVCSGSLAVRERARGDAPLWAGEATMGGLFTSGATAKRHGLA